MNTVTLEVILPEDVYVALQSAGLGREELSARAARDLAVQLYSDGRLSLGKAAKLARLTKLGFWSVLVDRRLPVFRYTDEDHEADLAALRRIGAKEAKA